MLKTKNLSKKYINLCRINKPEGILLTLFPCIAALIQANNGLPDLDRLFIFSIGAILMRSIGCTINDIFDRDFDIYVERTKNRPLASKEMNVKQAILFLIIQSVLCVPLLFFINRKSLILAVILLPLVISYPLCKRITYWPQLILGICFNWGILMASTDTNNCLTMTAFLMWFGAIFWQIGYDSIYAYSDIKDDIKIGINSTAILFSKSGKFYISIFYLLAILFWLMVGFTSKFNYFYYGSIILILFHFIWQIFSLDLNNTTKNIEIFKSNVHIGLLLIFANYLGIL